MIDNRQFGNLAINVLAKVGLSIGTVVGGRSIASLLVINGGM
jgi:hypothetical protein